MVRRFGVKAPTELTVTAERPLLDLRRHGVADHRLQHASLSPAGTWLAIGTVAEGERWLAVVRSSDLETVHIQRERLNGLGRWFWWDGPEKLVFYRQTGRRGQYSSHIVELFFLEPTDWNEERRVPAGPVDTTLLPHDPPDVRELRSRAGGLVQDLGYVLWPMPGGIGATLSRRPKVFAAVRVGEGAPCSARTSGPLLRRGMVIIRI